MFNQFGRITASRATVVKLKSEQIKERERERDAQNYPSSFKQERKFIIKPFPINNNVFCVVEAHSSFQSQLNFLKRGIKRLIKDG